MKKYIIMALAAVMFLGTVAASDYIIQDSNGNPLFVVNESGEKQVYNGPLDMNGNEISSVGALDLGWRNLTDYPAGCQSDEAVRVIGDTLDCVPLNPGGTVETGGGAEGQVAFFLDAENITGSDNFYWNNSQVELGIGTNNPSATLDVNGDVEINNGLDMASGTITSIGDLEGTGIVNNNQIFDGAVTSAKIGSQEVTSGELNTGVAGTGLSGGGGSSLSVNTDTGLTTSGDNVQIDTNVVPRKGVDETISASRWIYENDVRIQGNLDVWGNISNTDVENLNINGSLLPPSGYSDTFDVGSSSRRWRTGYYQDMVLGDNSIDNNELANSGFATSTNSGINSGSVNLGGTLTIDHADTSSISDTSNSNGQVIQDLTFDGFGHVQTQTTTNLDNRYYTESESDSNFVDEAGDTMSGSLTVADSSDGSLRLQENDVGSTSGTPEGGWNYIEFYDGQYDRQGYFGIDTNGDMRFQPEVSGGRVRVNSGLDARGDIDVNSNSITNFFGSNCQSDEVVESVNSDGTYNCQSITGTADDTYVNEAGDSMTGNLDMQGNNIQNVGTINASTLEKNGNSVTSLFLDVSGDAMSGQINMQGNPLNNVGTIDMNSQGQIQTDGTDAVRIDSSQNVEVPNGDLDLAGNEILGAERVYTSQIGSDSNATGTGTIAIGRSAAVENNYGVAIGDGAYVNTYRGVAIGVNSEAQNAAVALGDSADAGNLNNAVAIGEDSIASGYYSVALGSRAEATGNRAVTIGAESTNSQDYTTRVSNDYIELHDRSNNQVILEAQTGGNVNIPNGGVDISGQLSVGSTECNTGEYIDGDGTCTNVVSETSGEYVNEAGDTMTGDLNMNYNDVGNVSRLNVSTSTDQIAHFSDTGVEIKQPLSVESSGPLSVSNGIDLTDGSSNTIESYSTMYLQTSSGSPSDIVLDPTGDVGVGANLSVTGDLDMQNGAITDIDWANSDQGAGSGLDADTLDGVQLSNINWGDTAMSQNDVDVSNLGAADANLDMNENQIQNVNALQDGTGTNTINFDGSNNVQIPNGNLDVSSPSSTDHTMDIGGSLGVEGNLDINSNNLNNVDQIDFDEDAKQKAQWYSSTYSTGVESSTLYWESNDRFRWYANGVGADGGSSDHMQLDSNQLDLSGVNLDMNNNIITGVSSPSDSDDAVPKSYVDNAADGANQTLAEVLSKGNDANSQAILNIGSGNIDIDGSGAGNIQLNSNEVRGGSITQSNNLIAGSYSTGESSVDGGDIWVENDVEVGGDVVGSGADVAENVKNESELEKGTVVQISGNMSVDKTDEKHDTQVAGVVSSDPAMIMAKEREGVPVAMTGTVPVKVTMENGEIRPGDMLTTAPTPGKAMKCNDMAECTGSIIGKAMEPAEKSSEIDMLISMS